MKGTEGTLKSLAGQLLEDSGGNLGSSREYYSIICGGSDDIYGMVISEEQLEKWNLLGEQGELAYLLLSLHAEDEDRAFGSFFYSQATVTDLLGIMASYRQDKGKAA